MNMLLPYRPSAWPLVRIVLLMVCAFALLLTLDPGSVRASLIVAEDDFEGHESGPTGNGWFDEWEFTGDTEIRNSGGPHGGSSHLRLAEEDASAVRSAEVIGESSLKLQLWVKRDDLDDNRAVIEVSNDGSSYVELAEWDDDAEYSFFEFTLSSTGLSFTDRVWFRARILGDDDDGRLYIDDLALLNSDDDPDLELPPNGIPVLIDGQFPDWAGKANLTDASGDQSGSTRYDIATFYWANNIDEEFNFHMLARYTTDGEPFDGENGQTKNVNYLVYIDTNNNGNYEESADRRAVVTYQPKKNDSKVRVKIYPGDSKSKISDSGWNDWGDSRNEGGLRVEFPLDWNDLGIQFGGVIRMYAISFTDKFTSPEVRDRVPDGNADIQWSPASVLGPWLLGAASIAGIAAIWFISRRRRLWM